MWNVISLQNKISLLCSSVLYIYPCVVLTFIFTGNCKYKSNLKRLTLHNNVQSVNISNEPTLKNGYW